MSYICLPKGDFDIFKRKKPKQIFLIFVMKPDKKWKRNELCFLMREQKGGYLYLISVSVCLQRECLHAGGTKEGKKVIGYLTFC